MRYYFFSFTLFCFPVLHSQNRPENFHVSADGKNFSWTSYQAGWPWNIANTDSFLSSLTYMPEVRTDFSDYAQLTPDGNSVYYYDPEGLKITNTNDVDRHNSVTICKGEIWPYLFHATNDGKMIIVGLDTKRENNCSPGNRRLLVIRKIYGMYRTIDTLGSGETCRFIWTAQLGEGGYVHWNESNGNDHLVLYGNNDRATEIPLSVPAHCRIVNFFMPEKSNYILYELHDSLNSTANQLFCCEKIPGGISAPEKIEVRLRFDYSYGDVLLAISPDGDHIAWLQWGNKILPNGNHDAWVMMMNKEGGKWTSAKKIFDCPEQREFQDEENNYETVVLSDSNLFCIGTNEQILFFNKLDRSGKLFALNLGKKKREEEYSTNYNLRTVVEKPVYAGEIVHLQFPFKNTTKDTLVFNYTLTFFEQYNFHRAIQTAPQGWTVPTFNPISDWPGMSWSDMQNRTFLAPGDSMIFDYYTHFQYCGQEFSTIFYCTRGVNNFANSCGIMLFAKCREVELPGFDRANDSLFYHNGNLMETFREDSAEIYHFTRNFSNGNPCMEISFNEKMQPCGTWKYFAENGQLIYEKKMSADRKTISYTT